MAQEIFRYLRPVWYDSKKHEVCTTPNGGICFMLKPTAEKTYNYWIYICPMDAPFSSAVAVKKLRERVQRNVVPWGSITLTGETLITDLLSSILAEETSLPSDVAKFALDISLTAWAAHAKKDAVEAKLNGNDISKIYEAN